MQGRKKLRPCFSGWTKQFCAHRLHPGQVQSFRDRWKSPMRVILHFIVIFTPLFNISRSRDDVGHGGGDETRTSEEDA